MAKVKVDVAIAFSIDPLLAEHIAEKNFDLAVRHDPSLNQQVIKFDSWSFINKKTGTQMYGAKYYYWTENNSPVVGNHPQLNEGKSRKGKAA